MGEMIWIEQLSRQGEILARRSYERLPLRIGRGYGNDFILDDPFVAPAHAQIERDAEGTLYIVDLSTKNGLFSGEKSELRRRIGLDGREPVRLGRSYVRVRTKDFPVSAEQPLTSHMPGRVSLLFWAILLYGLVFGSDWLDQTKALKPLHYLFIFATVTVVLLLWSGFWAILSRIFTGSAAFGRHLKLALLLFFAVTAYSEIMNDAAFAFSSQRLLQYGDLGLWALLGAFCFFHLRANGEARLALKAAAVSLFVLLPVLFKLFSEPAIANKYDYVYFLKPAMMRLVSPQPGTEFFAGALALKKGIDAARKEDPAGQSSF
ncbi:MAG: FHA domain-containing protein [Pseudomonadota bacterium]|nr:FHA domain-containing protein [Pseudomonadota bacterium]